MSANYSVARKSLWDGAVGQSMPDDKRAFWLPLSTLALRNEPLYGDCITANCFFDLLAYDFAGFDNMEFLYQIQRSPRDGALLKHWIDCDFALLPRAVAGGNFLVTCSASDIPALLK